MRSIFSFILSLVVALSVTAKEKMSVLYVGGSSDYYTSAGEGPDSITLAKSVKTRMADWTRFLKQNFTTVKSVEGKDYKPEMSKSYDVTVFDGKCPAIVPEIFERDSRGRTIKYSRAKLLPDDFDSPAVMIAEMSELYGRSIGSKNDWFCLCLDNYALGWDGKHPVFNTPNKVVIDSVKMPTPGHAFEYGRIYGYEVPDSVQMWLIHDEIATNGGRIGMVSRPWGYLDSPETEIISGGKCAKSLDAVAIGRHANLMHWGFAARPSQLTPSARAALVNAIAYMKQFRGQHPIARKMEENISTRPDVNLRKYMVSRDCMLDQYKTNVDFKKMVDSIVVVAKAAQAEGKELTSMQKVYMNYPPMPEPKLGSYADHVKHIAPDLYPVFGIDEEEYFRYYDRNRPYFYGIGRNGLVIDQEARDLGIANNDIRLLDRAVEMLGEGEENARVGRTLLERYTLCRFETPGEWKKWLDENRDRMFFTESGGWLWLVNTLDPTVPGNDYSVLEKKETPAPAPVAAAGETDAQNPVALKVNVAPGRGNSRDIVVTMSVHKGFHAYANVAEDEAFIPTEITVELPEGFEKQGSLKLPAPTPSATATTYYTGNVAFRQAFTGKGNGKAVVKVRYQVCNDQMCMPPVTKQFEIDL